MPYTPAHRVAFVDAHVKCATQTYIEHARMFTSRGNLTVYIYKDHLQRNGTTIQFNFFLAHTRTRSAHSRSLYATQT